MKWEGSRESSSHLQRAQPGAVPGCHAHGVWPGAICHGAGLLPRGDFAQAYVIAHEVGHHVQNLMGISGKMDQARGRVSTAEYNALQRASGGAVSCARGRGG